MKKALTIGVYNPKLIYTASPMCGDQVFSKGLEANGYKITSIDYREIENVNQVLTEIKDEFDIIWLGKCEKISEYTIYTLRNRFPNAYFVKHAADVRDEPTSHDISHLRYCDFFFGTFGGEYLKKHKMHMPAHAKAMSMITFTDSSFYKTKRKDEKYSSDILWTGRRGFGDNPLRNDVIDFLKFSKYNTKMFGIEGTDWIQDDYIDYINNTKIGIGINSFNRTKYTSDRLGNYMSCGTFYLPHYFEGIDEVFSRGENLDWFENIEELEEKIEYYLKNEKKRKEIAQKGQKFILEHFDYKPLVSNFLHVIKYGTSKYPWDEIY
jgi:hypothetical protein